MSLLERQQIFALNVAHLIRYAFDRGLLVTLGEAYRTQEQQQIYFDSGKSKTLESRHTQRLAIDINLFFVGHYLQKPQDYAILGEFWTTLHPSNVWGGDWNRNKNILDETFSDPYHFEMKPF